MKILRIEYLNKQGDLAFFSECDDIISEVKEAILKVHWPPGNSTFILNPTKMGNGVKPIKSGCMAYLYEHSWRHEARMKILASAKPGPVDAVKTLDGHEFILEWETGNISSSHRALNKIAVGMLEGCIAGGILIVPSRDMYKFLTDRVGNYREIEPYFPVWRCLAIKEGMIAVIEIEHDALSDSVPLITKGTDGRALR